MCLLCQCSSPSFGSSPRAWHTVGALQASHLNSFPAIAVRNHRRQGGFKPHTVTTLQVWGEKSSAVSGRGRGCPGGSGENVASRDAPVLAAAPFSTSSQQRDTLPSLCFCCHVFFSDSDPSPSYKNPCGNIVPPDLPLPEPPESSTSRLQILTPVCKPLCHTEPQSQCGAGMGLSEGLAQQTLAAGAVAVLFPLERGTH